MLKRIQDMGHWNYRVVRKKHTWHDPTQNTEQENYSYAIHEAYYDDNGYVGAITQEPVAPYGDTVEELRHSWVMMVEAFGQPILDYENIPEPGYNRKDDPLGPLPKEHAQDECIQDIQGKPDEPSIEDEGVSFHEAAYREQREQERRETEQHHEKEFYGTPTLKQLIDNVYEDYNRWRKQESHQ